MIKIINKHMRPKWSGIIGFGLVNIPIKIYSASEEQRMNFHYLRKKDLCPIKYQKVCEGSGEIVPYNEIVRGFEFEKGRFVIFEDDELKKINPKKSQMIEIINFVKEDDLDLKLVEKPYYIEPDKNSARAYALFSKALASTKRVGIARFVMHTREYLAALYSEEGMLILDQLRYPEQVRTPEELKIPEQDKVDSAELEMAIKLIDQLTVPFDPGKYKDTYDQELKKAVEQKLKGQVFEISKEEMPMPTAIPDIMSKLKESLEFTQNRRRRK